MQLVRPASSSLTRLLHKRERQEDGGGWGGGRTGDGQEQGRLNVSVSLGTRREEAALSEHPHLRGTQETHATLDSFIFLVVFVWLSAGFPSGETGRVWPSEL